MTSQRELFPRLTADMRRFRKLPQIQRDPAEAGGKLCTDPAEAGASLEQDLWEESPSEAAAACVSGDGNEFFPLLGGRAEAGGLLYSPPLFPLLNTEVATARRKIQASVEQAMGHCRRDNLWRRLFHGEHLALDKLKLTRLTFSELEELLEAVQSRSVGEIDPQLVLGVAGGGRRELQPACLLLSCCCDVSVQDCFLTMSPAWYQSLIKVLLSRFPHSCRHFDDSGVQYLVRRTCRFSAEAGLPLFLIRERGRDALYQKKSGSL